VGPAIAAQAFASMNDADANVEVGGVRFSPVIPTATSELALHGSAVLRYRVLLRAYAAALYLARGTEGKRALDDVPKRLELESFWRIEAADFGRTADALLARTLSASQLATLRDRLAHLHAHYEDVAPGDRYALTYVQGVGTEDSKNGRRLAVIAGSDFAFAYFSMWLGDDPIDAGLRDELRNGLSGRALN
jgi:Chalcone isomerase-like